MQFHSIKESPTDELSDDLLQAATNNSVLMESPPSFVDAFQNHRSRSISTMSTNLIRRKSDEISVKEQSDIAQQLCAQIDQLKADNEAMGYTDLMDHTSFNALDTETETEHEIIYKPVTVNKRSLTPVDSKRSSDNHPLTETRGLREKLDKISTSINQIRQVLMEEHTSSTNNKAFFQNELTEIQDQIEEIENEIECNIDVKIREYVEALTTAKQKIKALKKEKKLKEKEQIMAKQKEQENIIKQQQKQIDQLIHTRSTSPIPKLPFSKGNKLRQRGQILSPPRSESLFHPNRSHYAVDDDDEDHENEYEQELDVNVGGYMGGGGGHYQQNSYNVGAVTMNGYGQHNNDDPGVLNEGQGHYAMDAVSVVRQKPLLSDREWKIVGGVVIVLAGVYFIGKLFSSRREHIVSTVQVIRPRRR